MITNLNGDCLKPKTQNETLMFQPPEHPVDVKEEPGEDGMILSPSENDVSSSNSMPSTFDPSVLALLQQNHIQQIIQQQSALMQHQQVGFFYKFFKILIFGFFVG